MRRAVCKEIASLTVCGYCKFVCGFEMVPVNLFHYCAGFGGKRTVRFEAQVCVEFNERVCCAPTRSK